MSDAPACIECGRALTLEEQQENTQTFDVKLRRDVTVWVCRGCRYESHLAPAARGGDAE